MSQDPISTFLKAVEAGAVEETDFYAEEAELDATTPNWRARVHGPDAIRAEYAKWFSEPATFVALERIPTPGGELVIYEHEWVANGVRHGGHHAHRIVVVDGKIASDTVWCGGKWPEPLLQDMASASQPR